MLLEGCEFPFNTIMVGFASEINAHLQSQINLEIFCSKERQFFLRSNNATHADTKAADLWRIVSQIATISLKSNYGTQKVLQPLIYIYIYIPFVYPFLLGIPCNQKF